MPRPTARGTAYLLGYALVVVAATYALGWSAPAVVGALAALAAAAVRRIDAAPGTSPGAGALATALAWGALLVRPVAAGHAPLVVATVGGLVGVHGFAASALAIGLALGTIAFGAALAWAAATCVTGVLAATAFRRAAFPPGRVTLSEMSEPASARPAERTPAAQTP
ncbi:hypothetical protein tb265_01350 [Gemmatimonadetes bacterium T265]|nr:hypothetical protein tb265_01350 [Gemmatimonadetes bacterium T265]